MPPPQQAEPTSSHSMKHLHGVKCRSSSHPTPSPTINSVRERTHWNVSNLRPRSPVELGLCSHMDLTEAVEKARKTRRGAQAVPMKASEMPEEPELPPEPPRYD